MPIYSVFANPKRNHSKKVAIDSTLTAMEKMISFDADSVDT